MHPEVLTENTKEVLFNMKKMPAIGQFYLAGGTALTLYLGHRVSFDLDFFAQGDFDELLLIQQLPSLGKFELEKKSPQSILGLLSNVKISFLGYRYPLLFPFQTLEDIKIADVRDIVCMKIDAISSRGTKRDFIDVYFVVKEIMPLEEILRLFVQKYAAINYNLMHIKKSLVFFDDAESESMPKMLKQVEWEEVKKFFKEEIIRLKDAIY